MKYNKKEKELVYSLSLNIFSKSREKYEEDIKYLELSELKKKNLEKIQAMEQLAISSIDEIQIKLFVKLSEITNEGKKDILNDIMENPEAEYEYYKKIRDSGISKEELSAEEIQKKFQKLKNYTKEKEMKNQKGFIQIQPTQEQWEKIKTGDLDLKSLNSSEKIEKINLGNGEVFEKINFKISLKKGEKYENSPIISTTNKNQINKILFYEKNNIPINIGWSEKEIEVNDKTVLDRKMEFVEDGRSLENLQKQIESQKFIKLDNLNLDKKQNIENRNPKEKKEEIEL